MIKRVAILNAFDPETCTGGIETFILHLKGLLSERNISVDTHYAYPEFTLLTKPFPPMIFAEKIPETIRRCFMLGRAFSKIQREYDLAIVNNFYGLGFFSPRIKSLSFYHSTHAGYADALKGLLPREDFRTLKYLYGHMGDRLSGMGKTKIAVSRSVRDELYQYYHFEDVAVIPHGIDTEFFRRIEDTGALRRKWDIAGHAFVGIFVGRWEIGKGTDTLEEIVKLHPDILWLLVIGPSECTLSGHDNIRIIKNADRDVLRELYSLSDVMVFPSHYEGFGLVIMEAMACGLPVISSRVGIAKDLAEFDALRKLKLTGHGKTAIIKEINEHIAFLRRETDEKNKIKAAGRSIVEKDFSIGTWRKRMSAALGLS